MPLAKNREEISSTLSQMKAKGASREEAEAYVRLASARISAGNGAGGLPPELPSATYGGMAREFGRGFLGGASFGVLGGESEKAGSVLEPAGERYSRGVGTFLGSAIPIVASEATGGAALGMAAARRGAGPVLQGIQR